MDDSKLHELIDACRPHHDDLAAPEMRDLMEALKADPALGEQLERSRRLDAAISDVMHSVAVPSGLSDRLLANTRKAERDLNKPSNFDAIVDSCVHANNTVGLNVAMSRKPTSGRRHWLWQAGQVVVSTAVLALLIMGVAWLRSPAPITRDGLSDQALAWMTDLPNQWQSMETAPEKSHSPGSIITLQPRGWQSFTTPHDRHAVAYDLTRNRNRAMLFVIRTNASSPFSATPSRLPSTGGWGMGAWKEGNALYVLVVDDARVRFESLVRPPRSVAQSHFSRVPLL